MLCVIPEGFRAHGPAVCLFLFSLMSVTMYAKAESQQGIGPEATVRWQGTPQTIRN